nr:ulp1 protease family, C-terminal catalytic domain-containing protein [Tanacetum cinerariifolium]
MVEVDKVKSESNEEPPLSKKKLDAPSFVDVRKLKGDMLVIKGAEMVVATERQVFVQKGKQKVNEGSLESFKEGKKDKDETILMVVEKGKEVVLNNKVKCDPVNILTRMSPIHLNNVLDSLTTKQKRQVEEQKNGGFGQLPILEGLELIEKPKIKFMKKKSKHNILEIGSMSREEELEQFKSKTVQVTKSVKDNEVSKEKDDVTEKEKDVENMFKIGGKNTVEDSQSETSIFDSQPEDLQPEAQDTQPGIEIVAEIQEENLEPVKRFGIEAVYFLSLYPEIEVASTIIDLWTLVLNNEEQHRDKLSGDCNVYCHTIMITQHSFEMGKDLEAQRESFDKNIDIVLKQGKRKNFDDVNLVFFPTIKMSKNNHFYVICFNLKTFEIDIIDKIDNGIDDIKTRYGGFPCAPMDSFIDYLERKKYQKCYDLILAKPKIVEIPWKTTYNSHDCGVFVMRHMETYLGKGNFLQELKKEGPGQKVQLNMLRAKYMVKILLMSFNEKRRLY